MKINQTFHLSLFTFHFSLNKRGLSLLEVMFALAISVIIIISGVVGMNDYTAGEKIKTAKMMLQEVRKNIRMYKQRCGKYPPIVVPIPECPGTITTNLDDLGQPFYLTKAGTFPADPVGNDNTVRAFAAATGIGGWLYDQTSGYFGIDLDNAKYGQSGTVYAYEENPSDW